MKERKARHKKYLRQEILDAASELFVEEGYENVSMRRIADKIEYSPTTIYLHFQDKAELLEQVCTDTFSRLHLALNKITGQSGDSVDRLKRGMHTYIQFGLENPQAYRAAFMMTMPDEITGKRLSQPDSPGMQAFDFMRRCVYDCIAVGSLREKDAELVSQTLWAGIHGITSLLISHGKRFPWVQQDKVTRSVVDTLVAGVAKG